MARRKKQATPAVDVAAVVDAIVDVAAVVDAIVDVAAVDSIVDTTADTTSTTALAVVPVPQLNVVQIHPADVLAAMFGNHVEMYLPAAGYTPPSDAVVVDSTVETALEVLPEKKKKKEKKKKEDKPVFVLQEVEVEEVRPGTTYKLKKGNTLYDIACKAYGIEHWRWWKLIKQATLEKLDTQLDHLNLQSGTVVYIPIVKRGKIVYDVQQEAQVQYVSDVD